LPERTCNLICVLTAVGAPRLPDEPGPQGPIGVWATAEREHPQASQRCSLADHVASGSRAANSTTTDTVASRRAANASACADAWSSHCASSTTHTSGRSPAASDSKLSTARPTRKRSGAAIAFVAKQELAVTDLATLFSR